MLYRVVLARHNDERQVYVRAPNVSAATTIAMVEWKREFGESMARVVEARVVSA